MRGKFWQECLLFLIRSWFLAGAILVDRKYLFLFISCLYLSCTNNLWAGSGDDQYAPLAREYVETAVARDRAQISTGVIEEEAQRLAKWTETLRENRAVVGVLKAVAQRSPETSRVIADCLGQSMGELSRTVAAERDLLETRLKEVEAAWVDVRIELKRREQLSREAAAAAYKTGHWATLLGLGQRVFLVELVLCFGGMLWLTYTLFRHQWRRRLNRVPGRDVRRLEKFVIIGGLAWGGLTVAIWVWGDDIYDRLLSVEAETEPIKYNPLQEDLRLCQEGEQLGLLPERRSLQYTEAEKQFVAALDAAFDSDKVKQETLRFREAVREICVLRRLIDAVHRRFLSDKERLDDLYGKLAAVQKIIHTNSSRRQHVQAVIGAGSCVGFLLWASIIGGLYLRERHRQGNTCPHCGTYGSLRKDRTQTDIPVIVCTAKHTTGISCPCRFPQRYRFVPRVSIPTLGLPNVGKTLWLAWIYRCIRQGKTPPGIQLSCVDSPQRNEFDRLAERIIQPKGDPRPTQHDWIPFPLLFEYRDNDPWGRSYLLFNMFDFAGEATLSLLDGTLALTAEHRRALASDIFLFFLDVSKSSSKQAQALSRLAEAAALARGIAAGASIQVPVAICLTKLDFLPRKQDIPLAGPDVAAWFYDSLKKIDPTGDELTIAAIAARSRLTANLCQRLWPDWSIEQSIAEHFGGGVQFFPLAMKGLDGRGEIQTSSVLYAPYGLFAPLLWGLHMIGYHCLAQGRRQDFA